MKIKGVIFDMDGVVVDNHEYHFKAWMDFSKKYKFELNEMIYREQYNGKTNADLFKMIFGDISPEKVKEYALEKEGMYQDIYAPHMKPTEGLVEFLDQLGELRVKIALGTSAPPMNVDFVLDRLNLRAYFPVIVDGTMVSKGKPDPEVYRLCSMKLGLEPEHCVVFEDSLAGLESGQRAGCEIVGVATSHRPQELEVKTRKIILDFHEAMKFID